MHEPARQYELLWWGIFEKREGLAYEAIGPDSYGPDYRKELKESGEWEVAWNQWKEPSTEHQELLNFAISALDDILKEAETTRQRIEQER